MRAATSTRTPCGERSDLDAVALRYRLRETLAAREAARDRAAPMRTDLDAWYGALYRRRMAMSLTQAEISCLNAARAPREEGLRLCREGHQAAAEARLRSARALLGSVPLCNEAAELGADAQCAAEGYTAYRASKSAVARRALEDALDSCSVLIDVYGYEGEARRVHLARNLVRVERVLGSGDQAVRLASSLVRYLDGGTAEWPLRAGLVVRRLEIGADERRPLMNQVWGEIVEAVMSVHPSDRQPSWAGELSSLELSPGGDFAMLNYFLSALSAWRNGETANFLHDAQCFFAYGPVVPSGWNALASRVDALAAKLGVTLPTRDGR